MRLMAVMAHPDDAEIWCGGTLILHAQKGDAIRVCILSYLLESIRGQEALQAGNQLGCEVEFLGLVDTAVRDGEDSVERVRAALDSFGPDVVITHWYDDMHPDHEGAFLLVRRAIYRLYFRDKMQLPPRVYCCDSYNSQGLRGPFKPDWLVDVGRVWEKKVAAINLHASQPVPFFVQMIDRQCRVHGEMSEIERAEGFVSFLVSPGTRESLGGIEGREAPRKI